MLSAMLRNRVWRMCCTRPLQVVQNAIVGSVAVADGMVVDMGSFTLYLQPLPYRIIKLDSSREHILVTHDPHTLHRPRPAECDVGHGRRAKEPIPRVDLHPIHAQALGLVHGEAV